MEQKPCVFCGIASKQIPSKIVYEDENSLGVLDINPRSKGMTIIIPKRHYREFDENLELSQKLLQTSLIVSEMLKQSLGPKSISLAVIDSEAVQHFHVRLYPVYEKEMPLVENQPQQTTEAELDELATKIRSVKVEVKKEEAKVEEKKEETKERSPEEAYWIRRSMDIA